MFDIMRHPKQQIPSRDDVDRMHIGIQSFNKLNSGNKNCAYSLLWDATINERQLIFTIIFQLDIWFIVYMFGDVKDYN